VGVIETSSEQSAVSSLPVLTPLDLLRQTTRWRAHLELQLKVSLERRQVPCNTPASTHSQRDERAKENTRDQVHLDGKWTSGCWDRRLGMTIVVVVLGPSKGCVRPFDLRPPPESTPPERPG
jgi:hypothetical protein